MMKALETYELLKPIVEAIDCTINVDSITTSGNEVTIYTCNTLWVTYGYEITIGTDVYKVIDLQPNEWIKVKGATPTATSFQIYKPFFMHGTVLAQSEVLNEIAMSTDKLPLIYFQEIATESHENDEESLIDRTTECNFYFLVDANFQDWAVQDHYRYAIRPMRNLLQAFVEALKASTIITRDFKYSTLDHAKFGVYLNAQGHTKMIFNDELSGTQMRTNLIIEKDYVCSDCE